MARFRKLAALLACAVMASTATACSDTTYSVKVGDEEVKAGVYIGFIQNELSSQLNMLYYQGITEDPFSQQVDGVPLSDYVKDYALKNTKEYIALKKQMEAEGLSLTEDQLKTVSSTANDTWDTYGALYEYEGISKESLKEIYKASLMSNALFDHYYAEDGKEPVSDEQLQTYINENFLRYKIIAIYKSSNSDEAAAAAENEQKLADRDKFLADAEGVSFEDFDEIIKAYDEYTAASSEDDSSSADESSETSSDESSDTSSEAESSSDIDDSSDAAADTDNDASSESDDTSADSEDTSSQAESDVSSEASSETSSDESSADESSEAETTSDPYENEVMLNFGQYSEEDLNNESGKLFKFISSMETGKAQGFENENGYYIVIKGDVTERTDYLGANRYSILQAMKSDDFQKLLDSWVEALNITVNEKAIKRYTPEVIYDRMNEYYEKNQA
ncbi:MAG: hypothetical protein IJ561_03240 [Ruminococcus sp.]|nr:hypothetical protein [Ruminococcus sp.]